MSGSVMLAGVAKRTITPPLGSELAGFDARQGVAVAVHDDLYVRALVIEAGSEVVALVSLDIIGLARETTAAVRKAVNASTRIPERNVILCATHTHCGPVTIRHFFNADQPLDEAYLESLTAKTIEAIEEAFANRAPSVLRSALVKVNGVAVNRRTESGLPVDDAAGVLAIEGPDGKLRALLVNYGCHPTVLGPNTLDVTRDFPHYLDLELKKKFGEQLEVLYFNGAEGDLSIGHKSFLSAVGVVAVYRTYQKAEEIGTRLATAVIAGFGQLEAEKTEIACTYAVIPLPLKSYRPYTEMKQLTATAKRSLEATDAIAQESAEIPFEVLQNRQSYLFARIDEYYSRLRDERPESTTLNVEATVVRLGATAMLFVSGEVFVEIALAIRRRSPFSKTMFFGLANDYIGYVPTTGQAESHGYEVVASRVTPEASRVFEDEAVKALELAFAAAGKER